MRKSKRIISLMLAVLMIIGCLSGCVSNLMPDDDDYDDDDGFVTMPDGSVVEAVKVTLDETKNGTAGFIGEEGNTMRVAAGTTQVIVTTPNPGYKTGDVLFTDENGEVTELEVVDNAVTWTVEKSGTVSVNFEFTDETITGGSMKLIIEENESEIPSYEGYILENADRSIVGDSDKLTPMDAMWVTHTFVNGVKLPDATLDLLWCVDEDNDGVSDNYDAYINQFDDYIMLYSMSDDSDYFVGKVSREISHAKVTEWVAGRNGVSGITYDDIIYDDETKLVYVPKHYQTDEVAGKVALGSTKIQLLYCIDDPENAELSVDITINGKDVDGDIAVSGVGHVSCINPDTELILANDDEARAELHSNIIDSIVVNDIEYENPSDMWEYNETTGILTFHASPAVVDTVEVNMSNGFLKKTKNFFSDIGSSVVARADGLPNELHWMGDAANDPDLVKMGWVFENDPVVDESFVVSASLFYSPVSKETTADGVPLARPSAEGNNAAALEHIANVVINGGSLNIDDLVELNGDLNIWGCMDQKDVYDSKGGLVRTITAPFVLKCAHLQVDQNFEFHPGFNDVHSGTADNPIGYAKISIKGVTYDTDYWTTAGGTTLQGGELTLAVLSPTSHTQAGVGVYKVRWCRLAAYTTTVSTYTDWDDTTPHTKTTIVTTSTEVVTMTPNPNGWVILHKNTAHPEYTDDNSAYSMVGATYGIYTSSGQHVATLTVQDEEGNTDKSPDLHYGTYYAREIASSKGYLTNSNTVQFQIHANVTVTIAMHGAAVEEPLTDPIPIIVQKKIEHFEAGNSSGDTPTLKGIKFRVDYYNDLYDSVAAAKASGKLNASAIFETDENGELWFFDSNPVNGTTWPYQENGYNVIPLGTVIVTEVSALDGLFVTSIGGYAFTITDDGYRNPKITKLAEWPNNYSSTVADVGIVENEDDTVWRGGVTVWKADEDRNKSVPQGDGTLEGITYRITNKSINPVWVNGKMYGVNDVIMDITTAYVATSDVPGTYTFKGEEPGEFISQYIDHAYVATTGPDVLPYGTYLIEELHANDSYHNAHWSQTFSIRTDGQMTVYDSSNNWNTDAVKRGGIEVVKADADTGRSEPQGDGTLAGCIYDIYNRSTYSVYVNGVYYPPNSKIMSIVTEYDESLDVYIARTGEHVLPYGTYEIIEVKAPRGYHIANYRQTVHIRDEGDVQSLFDASSRYNTDEVLRGGVTVIKADADWHESWPQGDATLSDVEYTITNRSDWNVYVETQADGKPSGREYAPGEVIMKIETTWNNTTKNYIATTGQHILPYGTYEITETNVSTGYNNANWSRTFSIRRDMEMINYDSVANDWNENQVKRGGLIVGKVDRETGQYISLGGAELGESVFEIINRSEQPVFVNGKTYAVGDVVMTIATEQLKHNNKTIYAAETGNYVLPYGTYEVREVLSGKGYLYDSTSKAWTRTFEIRSHGEIIDMTDLGNKFTAMDDELNVGNQVLREDWHFQKKSSDSQDVMPNVAFLITSITTGERHIIVTNENGVWGSASASHNQSSDSDWGSAFVDHTHKTNANDPNSPISNGAVDVDEDGNWYVADSSKLDCDAGTWFTGMPENMTSWKASGGEVYYTVNGKTVFVDDTLRAFPYDTYTVEELPCAANESHKLVSFTVTLKRYTEDHDGPGLNIDYGTINDEFVSVETILTFDGTDKIIPNADDVTITDSVLYGGLDSGKYHMVGELWLVSEDGETEERLVASNEADFVVAGVIGSRDISFNLDTTDLGGRTLVAYEYLYRNGELYAWHEDLHDLDQRVKVLDIYTTLTGDLDHMSYGTTEPVTLTDTITYDGLEVGKTYTITGTLMDKATGESVRDANDNPITATTKFVPANTSGTVDVVFKFSGVDLAGHTVVAFETISRKGVDYAVHADINDEDQTVYYPALDSFAVDAADGNKDIAEAKDQSVTDYVKVTNFLDGYEYKLEGEVHVRNADGEDEGVISTKEFTWTGNDTDQTMTFNGIDASKLGGKDLVVFQNLYGRADSESAWVLLGVHNDIADDDQCVHVPHIETMMLTEQGIHEIQVPEDGVVSLTDTISYKNLTPGHTYAILGTLHIQDVSDDSKISDGGEAKDISSGGTFVPETANGAVEVTFTFDASDYAGKTVVAYEKLYSSPDAEIPDEWISFFDGDDDTFDPSKLKEKWITARHEEITDEKQAIHFAEMETTMTSDKTGLHMTQVTDDGMVALTDVVKYTNLIPGNTYTVTGSPHIQVIGEDGSITDGGAVKDAEGNDLVKTYTFVPTSPDGQVEIVFIFDASELIGKTTVAFETMSHDGIEFAVHADITDESQSTHFVEIGTKMYSNEGLHVTQVPRGDNKTVTLTDTVSYENVIPGLEYVMTGTLHLQSVGEDGSINDGGILKDKDGNDVTGTVTFTPDTAAGSVDVTFTFDASALSGKTTVAYETLSFKGIPIATHEDISDEGQAVHFADLWTTATTEDGIHLRQVTEDGDTTVTITDTVEYKNLIPGLEYNLNGTLHVRNTDSEGKITDGGIVKDEDGNDVTGILAQVSGSDSDDDTDNDDTSEDDTSDNTGSTQYVDVTGATTFIPKTADGFVEMKFTFDATSVIGKTTVVFESLSLDGRKFAVHEDITDEKQSIHFVEIGTTALTEDQLHITQVPADKDKKITIADTVDYKNLIPGQSYEVTGTLHIQDTDEDGNIIDGGVVKDASGKEVTSTVKFTAVTADGSVTVLFTFDASGLDGKTIVTFESMSHNGVKFAVHADITDKSQSTNFVKVGTTALTKDGLHIMQLPEDKNETITITDTVSYENIIPGMEYTLVGVLHIQDVDKDGNIIDGGTVKNGKGNAISSKATFKPTKTDGEVDMTFEVKASDIKGKTLVVFETLYYNDSIIAVHEDIKDENQSIHFADIGTTALTKDGLHEMQVDDEKKTIVTITDTIAYENLIPGLEYTIDGRLHIRGEDKNKNIIDAGIVKDADGNEVIGVLRTVNDANDADDADTDNTDNTEDSTNTGNTDTSTDTGNTDDNDTDTGDNDTDDNDTDADNTDKIMTFVPEKANGTIEMVFTFDASALAGRTTVAYEYLSLDGIIIASHEDIKDEAQSTHFVEIGTTALTKNGVHEAQVPAGDDKTFTFSDILSYENLIPGKKYTVTGTLHVQDVDRNDKIIDGGALKDSDNKTVTSTVTFTPEAAKGTVEIPFSFDASKLEGKTIVAFESLSRDGVEIAKHMDITDEGQSLHFVEMRTTLLTKDKLHEMQVPSDDTETVKLTDTITYKNLIPGNEYTVTGTLHIQEVKWDNSIADGGTLKNTKGNAVVSTASFIPKKPDGSVDVVFTLKASELAALNGKTIVAFESMSHSGVEFAVHADIKDEAQSVHLVDIGTTAVTTDGSHKVKVPEGKDTFVRITDTVTYTNLTPGNEYTVAGTLHVKNTNKNGKIVDSGELKDAYGDTIKSQTVFTPSTPNGKVEVVFDVNTSDMYDGTLVVFESLIYKKYVIAEHNDITDEDQSITFIPPEETSEKPSTPETPDTPEKPEKPEKPSTTEKPQKPQTTEKPDKPKTVERIIEVIKTGQNMFLLTGIIGLAAMSGGGYFFFAKTSKGRNLRKKIRKLFSKK